ncbi:MAG: AAA family ATPase [Promethearchaeota archaeon]
MNFPTHILNTFFKRNDPLKGIFSVWGDFGVGKTTFALQTAINSAKIGKRVIFIYTKPNFPLEKVNMMKSFKMLDNIAFIQTTNFNELNKITFNFEFLILKFLKENNESFDLIVIDSLTNLYRIELNKNKKEKNYNLNYQLSQILANLCYINETYGIEILIINEISRKNINDRIIEVQSGGKVMEYWVTYSIKLMRTKKLNERKFILTKDPENKSISYKSILTENGFEK